MVLIEWNESSKGDSDNTFLKGEDIKCSFYLYIRIDNKEVRVDKENISFCDLEEVATRAGVKNWNEFKIPSHILADKAVLSYRNQRFVYEKDNQSDFFFLKFNKNENSIVIEQKDLVSEADMSNLEVFLKEAYENLPIYIEESSKELYAEVELGLYCHSGRSGRDNKCYPCVILYRNNIKDSAIRLSKKIKEILPLSTIIHYLTVFVSVHELAHAFFNKDGYKDDKDREIEECLANYVALLYAKASGDELLFKIGKLFVQGQGRNKLNKGYNYSLKLFDDNDNPNLTGWWKWRYCKNVKNKKNYRHLKVSDLIKILDAKI